MSVDDLRVAGNVIARALPEPIEGVHAWWRELDSSDSGLPDASSLLSPAENTRAQRFGTPLLRQRYISGRATLRLLLGRWLDLDPADVPLVRGAHGRPRIELPGAPDFNVSHTRDAALVAIATSVRIGVDLERRDRDVNAVRLARKFLTASERLAMGALAADARRELFLRLWTCKEAMCKATGDGLSAPLGRLSVSASQGRLELDSGPAPYLPADWQLVAIDVPTTHVATAALWRPLRG